MALGLVVFTGIGMFTTEVHPGYPAAFLGFVLGAAIGSTLVARLPDPSWAQSASSEALERIDRLRSPGVATVIIVLYLLCRFSVLLVPTVRIELLLSPAAPDLAAAFGARFTDAPVAGGVFLRYGATLLFPFFLISLTALRRNLLLFSFLLLLPSYFQYASDAYISRGELALPALLVVGNLWILYPRLRVALVGAGVIAAPLLVLALAQYAVIRLGSDASDVNLATAFESVARFETSLPAYSWAILNETARADLGEYARWVLSLPFPKVVIGAVTDFRLNTEIAELALGIPAGERGFFVFLTGIVTESVYLFGESWNWIHGLTVGIVVVGFARAVPTASSTDLIRLYGLYLAGYVFPRGGVSAGLPPILNGMIAFYAFLTAALLAAAYVPTPHSQPDLRQ